MKQCYTLTGLDVLGKIRSYIRLLTVILLYVTFALPASAQGGGKAVSGIVKDDTGNPLIGVTVTVPVPRKARLPMPTVHTRSMLTIQRA